MPAGRSRTSALLLTVTATAAVVVGTGRPAAASDAVVTTAQGAAGPSRPAPPGVSILGAGSRSHWSRRSLSTHRSAGTACTLADAGVVVTNTTASPQTVRVDGAAFPPLGPNRRMGFCASSFAPVTATFTLKAAPRATLVVHFG